MCMCGSVCDSVTVVALDTHPPPSRQYSRWLFLSLDKLSGVAPHHQACPRGLSVAHCFSSTSTSSTTVGASLSPSINQSINHLGEGFDATCLSLSLLNEGIVVSERERERERERESMLLLFFLFSCIQRVCVCVTILPTLSLSLNRDPPNQAHNVCVCDIERLG